MTDIETKRYRAAEAKRLLDDPLLTEAFQRIEKGAIEEMIGLKPEEDVARRHLAERVKIIRATQSLLRREISKLEVADQSAQKQGRRV